MIANDLSHGRLIADNTTLNSRSLAPKGKGSHKVKSTQRGAINLCTAIRSLSVYGAPGAIRTPDPLVRSPNALSN